MQYNENISNEILKHCALNAQYCQFPKKIIICKMQKQKYLLTKYSSADMHQAEHKELKGHFMECMQMSEFIECRQKLT